MTATAYEQRPAAEDVLRLYAKADIVGNGECWTWLASRNARGGYGRFKFLGKLLLAHRLTYNWFVGPVPQGLELDHLCRNTRCVNPFHLEPVTAAENVRRGTQGAAQRAKTHCPKGHAYDDRNTYVNSREQRLCRACGRERMRIKRAAQ